MRRWRRSFGVACAIAALLAGGSTLPLSAQPASAPWTGSGPPPGLLAPCDQFNPFSPASSTRITLDSRDFVDRRGEEMRSFVETDSLGKVAVAVVSSTPEDVVLGISAVPEISRASPYFGERLKGIALDLSLSPSARPVRVVLDVRQVCARHFRSTFLYY